MSFFKQKYTGYLSRGTAGHIGQGNNQWSGDADGAQSPRPSDNMSHAIIQKVRWKLEICSPPLPIHNKTPKSLQSLAELSYFFFFPKLGLEKEEELNTDK